MADLASQLIQRLESLKSQRSEYESHWRSCYKFTFPHRGTGFSGVTSAEKARAEQAELLDSTGTDSANTLAASIVSGMTPSNSRWLNLKADATSDNVNRWLAVCSDLVWKNIHSSNFDAESFESAIDGVVGGMFALHIDIDRVRGGFQFQQWPLSQCYFASTTNMLIDTVFRCYELTAIQAVTMFGSKVSETIRTTAEKSPETKYQFVHAIMPRPNYKPGGLTRRNMPYASYHISMSDKKIVTEGGYREFPVVAPRWSRIPGSCYAVGAVSLALPDIKELNELKRWEKQACELAVAGMYVVADDGVISPNVQIGPRKVIVANTTDSIRPLTSGSNFQVAFTSEQRLQEAIRKIMMADILGQANSRGTNMTATEVQARLNLLRQQLGPIFGRYQAEYLTPMVERCFLLMLRNGALPPPPREIVGVNFNVHFDNPLARSQKLTDVAAIQQFEANLMELAQAFPEVIDIYDTDAAAREKAMALGVPMTVIRAQSDVDALRQQKQQAAQQQQMAQVGMQMALQSNQAQSQAQANIASAQAAQGAEAGAGA